MHIHKITGNCRVPRIRGQSGWLWKKAYIIFYNSHINGSQFHILARLNVLMDAEPCFRDTESRVAVKVLQVFDAQADVCCGFQLRPGFIHYHLILWRVLPPPSEQQHHQKLDSSKPSYFSECTKQQVASVTQIAESRSSLRAALEGIVREWVRMSIYRLSAPLAVSLWLLTRSQLSFVIPDQPGSFQTLFLFQWRFSCYITAL